MPRFSGTGAGRVRKTRRPMPLRIALSTCGVNWETTAASHTLCTLWAERSSLVAGQRRRVLSGRKRLCAVEPRVTRQSSRSSLQTLGIRSSAAAMRLRPSDCSTRLWRWQMTRATQRCASAVAPPASSPLSPAVTLVAAPGAGYVVMPPALAPQPVFALLAATAARAGRFGSGSGGDRTRAEPSAERGWPRSRPSGCGLLKRPRGRR